MTTTPNDQQNQSEQSGDQQPQTIDPSRVLTDERGHIVVKDGRVQLRPEPTTQKPADTAPHEEPAAEGEAIEGQLSSDQGPDGDYKLLVPRDVPVGKVSDEWLGTLGEFAGAARDAGLPYSVAQAAVEAFVDADSASPHRYDYDVDDAERVMRGQWRENYDTKMAAVQKTVASLGDGFREMLDRTNMGNVPAVLEVLSLMGDMRLSKAEAQAELQKLTGDSKSEYFSNDSWRRKPAVVRAKILARIAYAEDVPATHPVAKAKIAEATRVEQAATKGRADARAEASKILSETKNFTKGTAQELQAKKNRFLELTSRI